MNGIRRIRTLAGDLMREPSSADAWVTEAVRHLRGGGLLAYPTETVYGLGCLLHEPELARLSQFKGGREGKPFLLLVAESADIPELRWTPAARALAERFWPGPLTLVLEDAGRHFPGAVRAPGGGVAVRVSSRPELGQLLRAVGAPLTSTSANRPGGFPATSPDEVEALLQEDPEGLEDWLFLDGGPLPDSLPSTIVDCTGAHPRVVRSGALPLSNLNASTPEIDDANES